MPGCIEELPLPGAGVGLPRWSGEKTKNCLGQDPLDDGFDRKIIPKWPEFRDIQVSDT